MTPAIIGYYSDQWAIHCIPQVMFTRQVKAGEARTIVKHTFGEGDEVYLYNGGTTPLKFYLAGTKDAQPGSISLTLAAKGEQTVLASALGKLTDTNLCVINTDTLHLGAYSAELV